jgi:ArsR family transcriptional regulator, arsenate/arsenite/antimonite-responsive transcriptional repressor
MEAKTEEFANHLQLGASAAKLLAHPARMAILEFLSKQNACVTGDISSHLPLSRGTVNQHLQALKDAGWVKGSIVGSKICYCPDYEKIRQDAQELLVFLQGYQASQPVPCTEK